MPTRTTQFLVATLLLLVPCCFGQGYASFQSPSVVANLTPAPTGGGSFTYYSTAFGGSAYVYGNALTGIADNKTGTISFWVKFDGGDGANQVIFGAADTAVTRIVIKVQRTAANMINVSALDTAGSFALQVSSTNTVTVASGWTHVFASWNLANGSQHCMLINGTSSESVSTYNDVNISWATGTPLYAVGSYRPDPNNLNGKLCEVWFNNSYVAASEISKFYSGGKPVNLGADGSTPTGSQPLLYLKNPYDTFANNAGSGGNFPSTQGTLADGGADKP